MSSTPYTVLARRFRPQTFADVVGQEHVGQALRNAIRSGRVAHAYLFTGARGVGKTSTARIFAKALNCPHAVEAVPCNACDICEAISAGTDVDVLEIDGASNRGIDDVRQLRANVNVKSMRSRQKVYIIDEVHMLTREAFNALLKTLEEPPPNVKFVFCTTEPNKVPDTILSRCQRFDFGTIASDRIAARLREIADAEGIHVDPEAIELVARRAAGSMRDSQSLFDQLLAFGEAQITTADVHRLLGTAPDTRLVELFEAVIVRDRASVLRQLDQALRQGVQLQPFSDQLVEYLRDLLIVLVGADTVPLSSVGESWRPTLREQGHRWGLATVTAAMQVLAETRLRMQRSTSGRALLELALIRLSLLEDLDDLARLVQQLETGGSTAGGSGRAGPPAAAPSGGGPVPAARRSDELRQKLMAGSPARSSTESPAPPPRSPLPQEHPPAEPRGLAAADKRPTTDTSAMATQTLPPKPQPVVAEPVRDPIARAELPANGNGHARSATEASSPSPRVPAREESSPEWSATAEEESPGEAVPRKGTLDWSPENVEAIWAQVIQRVPDALATHLKNAEKLAISGPNVLELRFPRSYQFSMNYCQRPEPLDQLVRIIEQLVGRRVEIKLCVDTSKEVRTPAPTSRGGRSDEGRLRPKVVENDPFVQQAVSIFGGTVADVRKVLEPPALAGPPSDAEPETESDPLGIPDSDDD